MRLAKRFLLGKMMDAGWEARVGHALDLTSFKLILCPSDLLYRGFLAATD